MIHLVVQALEGVKNFPVRIKCALLSWATLVDGIENWEKGEGIGSGTNTEL